MALQVWLPLNGDLLNQGLDHSFAISTTTPTWKTDGKLGKNALCCSPGSGVTLVNSLINVTNFSVSYWLYIDSSKTDFSNYADFWGIQATSGDTTVYIRDELRTNTANLGRHTVHMIKNAAVGSNTNTYYGLGEREDAKDRWCHVIMTKDANYCDAYADGVRYAHVVCSNFESTPCKLTGNIYVGMTGCTSGYIQDFRIYDHVLSKLEIKKLAQGLFLHYPLNNNGCGPSNLILNGFGELNTTNWSNSSNIYTDIPSSDSSIKKSYKDNWTLEYIPIHRNHIYHFSSWVKATSGSGTTYPSLQGYDIDKKEIRHYNCPDGFDLNTMTTLTQQLKAGDTKIYVASLANWRTESGHYYNNAAIFSYKDSTGYVYPDGTYTQNVWRFASGNTTTKDNLDKTNNIITLQSTYNGSTMPVGTKVCASTDGSTYIYPFGGISCSTITNWTFKEANVSSEINRLKYAKYVRAYAYSTVYQAGLKLVDVSLGAIANSLIEYDCSGFGHNGTRVGAFSYTTDTPKYSVSTVFDASHPDYIRISNSSYAIQGAKEMTWSIWAFDDDWTSFSGRIYSCTEGGGVNIESANSGANLNWAVNMYTTEDLSTYAYQGYCSIGVSTLSAGWHMFTWVYTTSGTKLYVDGELKNSVNIVSYGLHFHTTAPLFLGAEAAANDTPTAGYYLTGKLSDFRIYATALSASDVKSLYQNCATIGPDGTIYGQIRN